MKQAELAQALAAVIQAIKAIQTIGSSIEVSNEKLVKSNTELFDKIAKFGFQLQHMDTLVSNVHSRMGLLENQMAFNKEAIASLAKIQAQQKQQPAEPEVTLTLPLSQAAQLLTPSLTEHQRATVAEYLGDGIIDEDTAMLLKNPKNPTVLSFKEKSAAMPIAGLGGKIQAIKLYRERTGLGLKEAKNKVEEWQLAQPSTKKLTELNVAT